MSHLQLFNTIEDLSNEMLDDGNAVLPGVGLLHGTKTICYLNKPIRKAIYENFDNGLFSKHLNVKRIWNNDMLIYENNGTVQDFEVIVRPENWETTGDYLGVFDYNCIIASPNIISDITVSIEGEILPTDSMLLIMRLPDFTYTGWGGQIKDLSIIEIENGCIIMSVNAFMNDGSGFNSGAFTISIIRDGVKLPTKIQFKGVAWQEKLLYQNVGENLTFIPKELTPQQIEISIDEDIDMEKHALYMGGIVDGVEFYMLMFFEGLENIIEGNCFKYPCFGMSISGGEFDCALGICEIEYNENGEIISAYENQKPGRLIDSNIVVINECNLNKIDTTQLVGNEITFETFNRFSSPSFSGTNLKTLSNKALKHNPVLLANTFKECTYLEHITLPSGLIDVDPYAFDYCTNLKSIVIPKTVGNCEDIRFFYCHLLNDITYHCKITKEITFNSSSQNGIIRVPEGTDLSYLVNFTNKGWTVEFI
jgi:hypothetical protein